jgi:hypothetical protein
LTFRTFDLIGRSSVGVRTVGFVRSDLVQLMFDMINAIDVRYDQCDRCSIVRLVWYLKKLGTLVKVVAEIEKAFEMR